MVISIWIGLSLSNLLLKNYGHSVLLCNDLWYFGKCTWMFRYPCIVKLNWDKGHVWATSLHNWQTSLFERHPISSIVDCNWYCSSLLPNRMFLCRWFDVTEDFPSVASQLAPAWGSREGGTINLHQHLTFSDVCPSSAHHKYFTFDLTTTKAFCQNTSQKSLPIYIRTFIPLRVLMNSTFSWECYIVYNIWLCVW